MVERICPACQHGNPIDNRFCGACGSSLDHHALAPARHDEAAIVIAGQRLPLAQVKQIGRAVAMGLVAVAAEAGMAWLRSRTERGATPTALALRPRSEAPAQQIAEQAANTVTIVSQRVIEVWEHGGLARQIVERHVWKKTGE
ncbi:MAG: zinc ribbon domain-containing protein [Chloroflexi bacterium OHK40]